MCFFFDHTSGLCVLKNISVRPSCQQKKHHILLFFCPDPQHLDVSTEAPPLLKTSVQEKQSEGKKKYQPLLGFAPWLAFLERQFNLPSLLRLPLPMKNSLWRKFI